MRFVAIAILITLLALPAFADNPSLTPGQVLRVDVNSTGPVIAQTRMCRGGATIFFVSNLANASDNDASARVWSCPDGTLTADSLVCEPDDYFDVFGNFIQTGLTGDADTGKHGISGVVAEQLVVQVTSPGGQVSRVTVICGA